MRKVKLAHDVFSYAKKGFIYGRRNEEVKIITVMNDIYIVETVNGIKLSINESDIA